MEVAGIILSIRPEFVDAIFAGRKLVELRRRRPDIGPAAVVYVYCTAPRKEVPGQFRCRTVHSGSPKELWSRFGRYSCISKARFLSYFRGVGIGYALEIDQARRWLKPVSLATLRRIAPNFWPPQFYRRISTDEPLFFQLSRHDQLGVRRARIDSRRPALAPSR